MMIPASWPLWAMQLFGGLASVWLAVEAVRLVLRKSAPKPVAATSAKAVASAAAFGAFQREYLSVYLVVMLADWLQGTNMYTLYSGYGVSVSTLFLTGFSSSLVFGTFVGLLVDRYGRKNACLLFCVLEVVINALEHVPSMPLLLLGRVLGGISTSLLFSAFESWMVSEHRRRQFPEEWLASTFSLAAAGNGFAAVLAGFVAQIASDARGDIGPFQLAIALTFLALGLVARWPENYGDAGAAEGGDESTILATVAKSFATAKGAILGDRRVALLAAVSALCEGATFTFVFMWVPTLLRFDGPLPMGLVFASFMMAITSGGATFGLLVGDGETALFRGQHAVERVAFVALCVAGAAMLVPAPDHASFAATLAAFLALEFCVGALNGCAATMRSRYIPDALQSAVMNLSRIPLNLLVVAGTTLADAAPRRVAFNTVAAAFALGALLQIALIRAAASHSAKSAGAKLD